MRWARTRRRVGTVSGRFDTDDDDEEDEEFLLGFPVGKAWRMGAQPLRHTKVAVWPAVPLPSCLPSGLYLRLCTLRLTKDWWPSRVTTPQNHSINI